MSDKIVLSMQERESGIKADAVRAGGATPAVIYGHGSDALSVAIDSSELEKAFAKAGGNQIVGLKVGDAKLKNAVIHDVQRDGRTGRITHADFYLIKMNEKLKAEIPLHMVGESTAVYQQEGTLMRPTEAIEVEALPADLPESIEFDISVLDDFDKTITVSDLKIPSGVEVLTSAEDVVAKVEPPRSDEEMEELDAPIDEAAEMPEGVQEDQEVVEEDQQTDKEPQNKAAGADPAATK